MHEQKEDNIAIRTIQPEDPFKQFAVDPIIRYPGYKSMDEFIDVERLTALDGYITARIKKRLKSAADHPFYTGPYKLQEDTLSRPGTRMIYLSESDQPDRYFDLDRTEFWHLTEAAKEFRC